MPVFKHNNKYSQGFSLIELLVVIGIIAVLAGLTTFNFNSARARARDVQRKNDLRTVQKALELYRSDNYQKFPSATWSELLTLLINGKYLDKRLSDPKVAVSAASWQEYTYAADADQISYSLTGCLENKTDGDKVVPIQTCGLNAAGVLYKLTQP